MGKSGIRRAYRTEVKGSITVRGKVEVTEMPNGKEKNSSHRICRTWSIKQN